MQGCLMLGFQATPGNPIHRESCPLQALVSLDGGHVDVASFSALAPLRQLTTLSISGCSLGDVPPALIQLTQLRVSAVCVRVMGEVVV